MPTAASSSASAANSAIDSMLNRRDDSDSASRCSIDRTLETGRSGSIDVTIWRTAAAAAAGILIGPDDDEHRPDGRARKQRLGVQHVELRRIARVERIVLDVAGDADDLKPQRLALAERDAFADGGTVGKILSRQRRVHDGHVRRALHIAAGEFAPFEKGNVHRAEIPGGRETYLLVAVILGSRDRTAFDVECSVAAEAAERQCVDRRRGPDAWHGPHAREELLVERSALLERGVLRRRRRHA